MTGDEVWGAALDECAETRLAEAGIDAPPVDALCLAATLGFVIALDDRQVGRARHVQLSGFDKAGPPAILLRPEPRAERRQWAVAHEIGEHFAYDVCARVGIEPEELSPGNRERIANALANRLLLPSVWFARDGRQCRWDLNALKSKYTTASYELIARRMLDDDAPVIVTILDQGRVSFRCGNFAGPLSGLTPTEQSVWRRAHATAVSHEHRDARYWIRAWPIHESERQREILRAEPTDGEAC